MPKLRIFIDGQPVLPADGSWAELTRQLGDQLVQVFSAGARHVGPVEFQVQGLMSLQAAKNAVAVLVKSWKHVKFIGGDTVGDILPLLPNFDPGAPHSMVEADPAAPGMHALKFGGYMVADGDNLAVRGPVVALRLVNLVRWAEQYGQNCKLKTGLPMKKSTFDAITLNVEPGLDVARPRPPVTTSTDSTAAYTDSSTEPDEADEPCESDEEEEA